MIPQKQELILMALISAPKTGAEIKSAILDATGIELLPASLYPTLSKMKDDGLIELESTNSGRLKYYHITQEGEMILNRQENKREYLTSF